MKQTINLYQFRDAFRDVGRTDQFSYKGLELLFEALSELEDDTGEEMELDPIAICCDFTECTVEDVANDYSIDTSDADDDNDYKDIVLEYLQDNTFFVGAVDDMGKDTTIIYQAF